MKNKNLIYRLIGLLSTSAVGGFLIINNTQAQSPNSQQNTHHPSAQVIPSQQGMMGEVDQHFIKMMISHHQQAVEMANLALTRAKHPEIKKLAQAIKNDQNREIQQMQTWYKAWYGKDVPATAMTHQEMMAMHQRMCQQMNPGMMKMPMNQNRRGMNVDLAALKNAPDFDKEFIRQMIPHHRMAVMMSQMATKKATKPEIRNLAQSIIKTQTAEINQMQQWYQAWYKSNPEAS
ncbi:MULTISPECIES: DUF305 domain-containing protein [Nostoc]|uniref:DUF305 domain-containing protein n=2 Tax=Nostoc TaxID=1177 RepID=A0ABR8IG33_9NOSO|nr:MULTISPECIES: DUF305 domain-containing protein [Nostoc]MBD2564356.1 DUF305 domain-containing protein [Nostoc linckia FACHB-391]MBD2650144.1 DUF305 domain-containing protein [Nostoc foliaceum FACHB-393]